MSLTRWQIFVFSLVPLALVFAGVIGGSFHGLDSDREVFLPQPTAAPAGSPAPGTTAPAGGIVLTIAAKDLKYDKSSLTAPPNTRVTVTLTNNDAGLLHNIAFYRTRAGTQKLATDPDSVGELFAGVATKSFSFTTPAAGSYFYKCDVHPDTMFGSFAVR